VNVRLEKITVKRINGFVGFPAQELNIKIGLVGFMFGSKEFIYLMLCNGAESNLCFL
jgi:hypothetical protein